MAFCENVQCDLNVLPNDLKTSAELIVIFAYSFIDLDFPPNRIGLSSKVNLFCNYSIERAVTRTCVLY